MKKIDVILTENDSQFLVDVLQNLQYFETLFG